MAHTHTHTHRDTDTHTRVPDALSTGATGAPPGPSGCISGEALGQVERGHRVSGQGVSVRSGSRRIIWRD